MGKANRVETGYVVVPITVHVNYHAIKLSFKSEITVDGSIFGMSPEAAKRQIELWTISAVGRAITVDADIMARREIL